MPLALLATGACANEPNVAGLAAAGSATESAKIGQSNKPDWELLPSEIPAPKKLMNVDGSKFKLEIIGAKDLRQLIFGDEKEGATFMGIGTGMQCYLSAQTVKEVMPELRKNAEVSQKPCPEFKRIDPQNTVEITAGEFRQMAQKFAESNYAAFMLEGLKEGEATLADKIRFALGFPDFYFYLDEFNYAQNYDKKSYEAVAASGEMTDAQLFKFASSLLVFAKDDTLKDFYKNELRALFKKANKEEIPCEFFASAFFTETDPAIKAEYKKAAQDSLNSNGILSCFWTVARASRIANLGVRPDGEDLDFIISTCSRAENLKGMLGDDKALRLLKCDAICAELLKKNPDFEKIAGQTQNAENLCPRENPALKTAYMRILAYRAYALHKLDEKSKSRGHAGEVKKLLGELKSLLQEDSERPAPFFMRLSRHSGDFALFLLKNLGASLNKYAVLIGEDFRDKLITESALGLPKKEIVRIKMRLYSSGIEACEKLEDPKERAAAFEIFKSSLKDGGAYEVLYALYCHSNGHNTPKNIGKAKECLAEFLSGLDKKPDEEKAKILESIKDCFNPDCHYIVAGSEKFIKLNLPKELNDMFSAYLKKSQNPPQNKQ